MKDRNRYLMIKDFVKYKQNDLLSGTKLSHIPTGTAKIAKRVNIVHNKKVYGYIKNQST